MTDSFFNDDMRLFMDHRVDWERLLRYRGDAGDDVAGAVETYRMVMETAASVCADIEKDAVGTWHEEVELVDGEVRVPEHIRRGYERLREAGLVCLPLSPQYGGAGLPLLLNCAFLEMLARADASLMTIVGLQTGVAMDIQKYAPEELRRQYLPRFASGELQGAMDLTEPGAGSDLGGIVTRAREENGHYVVDGEKIFITNGGADVHLVLARDARTFDQTRGTTKGLDLLLCPRVRPDGSPNGVRVRRVERKLGIHGSPTCTVEFEGAQAFLLGEVGQGFRAMLDLMNAARLGVAAQAIGIAEAAFRAARGYAEQRVQFGAPIIRQPLVKSMLTLMAINIQAARAILYRTCAMIDMMEAVKAYLAGSRGASDPDRPRLEQEVEENTQLVRFLTPLCKYYATEIADHVTRQGIQVHGGIGYMADTPAGHYHCDSIITTIYEGTSEIQASFALREMSKGTLVTALERVRGELAALRTQFPDLVEQVCDGIGWINKSVPGLMGDLDYALHNAKRLSEMVVDVLVSSELLLQAAQSPEKADLATAYIHRHMLAVEMAARRISGGDVSRIRRYDRILGLSPAA